MRKLTLALKLWTVAWNKEKEFIRIQHRYFPLSVGTVGRCKEEPSLPDKCTVLGAWPAKHPLWHKKREAEQWTLPRDSKIHYPNIVYGLQTLVQNQVWNPIPGYDRSLYATFHKSSLAKSPSRTTGIFGVSPPAKVSPRLATLHVVHYVTKVGFPISYCNTLCASLIFSITC